MTDETTRALAFVDLWDERRANQYGDVVHRLGVVEGDYDLTSSDVRALVERVRTAEADAHRFKRDVSHRSAVTLEWQARWEHTQAALIEARAKLDTVRALALSTRSGENDHRYWVQAWDQHALPVGDVLAILDRK